MALDTSNDPFSFLRNGGKASVQKTQDAINSVQNQQSSLRRISSGIGGSQTSAPSSAPAGSLQKYAQGLLNKYGWGNQWNALNKLVTQESSWNPNAVNKSSGAWGLAQILPSAHPDIKSGSLNGQQQLDWMFNYIKNRYGSPDNAWAFHTRNNWY